eukprot:jgi/Tetstr1/430475/TSEL_020283.t1
MAEAGGGEVCSACGAAAVDVDGAEGFAVCSACGFVPPTTCGDLLVAAASRPGDPPAGVFVAEDGGVQQRGGGSGGGGYAARELYRPEQHRAALAGRCATLAATMGLPRYVATEARGHLLALLGDRPCKGHYVDVTAAACVYAAARCHKMAVCLVDAAAALPDCGLAQLGQQYRAVVGQLGLAVPPLDPSALLLKAASGLAAEGAIPPLTRRPLYTHPLVSSARALLSWASAAGLYDGRRPMNCVAAALMLAGRLHGCELRPEQVAGRICAAVSQSSPIRFQKSPDQPASLACVRRVVIVFKQSRTPSQQYWYESVALLAKC